MKFVGEKTFSRREKNGRQVNTRKQEKQKKLSQ